VSDPPVQVLLATWASGFCALTCGLRTNEYLASLSPDMLEVDLSSFAKTAVKNFYVY